MNPQEAGFDGLDGIRLDLPQVPGGFIFKPRRGSTPPWKTTANYQNQLFWHQSTPPRLLYCNNDGKWFELSFTPIQTQ